jgi:hypothetical protein
MVDWWIGGLVSWVWEGGQGLPGQALPHVLKLTVREMMRIVPRSVVSF